MDVAEEMCLTDRQRYWLEQIDDDLNFAMLVRRDGETLKQLLIRLDRAIEMAVEDEIFIDEVNHEPDDRL